MKVLCLMLSCCTILATCWGEGASSSNVGPLTENVTIHVRGSFSEDSSCDIQLSGIGPRFTSNTADPSTSFDCTLETTNDGKLLLSYSFGASVPIKSGGNTQYKNVGFQGRVAVAYCEDVKIASVNGKDLVLTVTRYGKPKK